VGGLWHGYQAEGVQGGSGGGAMPFYMPGGCCLVAAAMRGAPQKASGELAALARVNFGGKRRSITK
jgi:hypothetical protein